MCLWDLVNEAVTRAYPDATMIWQIQFTGDMLHADENGGNGWINVSRQHEVFACQSQLRVRALDNPSAADERIELVRVKMFFK